MLLKFAVRRLPKKSGGIGMFIKSSIYDKCMFHDTECEYVQWCQLSKSFLNSDEDLMLGVVYIPPENTKYFKQNIVDLMYADLESFVGSQSNVLLMDEFRARTATVDDIAIPE